MPRAATAKQSGIHANMRFHGMKMYVTSSVCRTRAASSPRLTADANASASVNPNQSGNRTRARRPITIRRLPLPLLPSSFLLRPSFVLRAALPALPLAIPLAIDQ
jgi:hypothetical protein